MESSHKDVNKSVRNSTAIYLTFFTRIVSPWYLNGFENSIHSARSLLMVNAATIRSAFPSMTSPTIPFQRFLSEPFTWYKARDKKQMVFTCHSGRRRKQGKMQSARSLMPAFGAKVRGRTNCSVLAANCEHVTSFGRNTHPPQGSVAAVFCEMHAVCEVYCFSQLDQQGNTKPCRKIRIFLSKIRKRVPKAAWMKRLKPDKHGEGSC